MTTKTRSDYSILNILTGIGGYILNTILGIICRIVFTKTLTADYLGLNGLFSNVLSVLSLAELGIGSAIVYALYKPLAENDKDKIASLVDFYGKCYRIIGIFIFTVGILLLPFLNVLIVEKPNISENLNFLFLIHLFNTASTYFFSYRASLLIAAQKNYLVTGINYLVTISQSIIQMIILIYSKNYIFYLVVQTIGGLIYNIVISLISKKEYPYTTSNKIKPLEYEEKGNLIKNIKALVIIKISGMIVNQTDNIIITYFNGLSIVGLASNYILLSSTLSALINQLFNGITASVGNHNALETEEKKYDLFSAINLAGFWLYGWGTIGIIFVSSDLVKLLFGNSYVLNPLIPFILSFNFYTVGMQSSVWTYKNTLGLFRPGRYLLILTAILNLVLSIFLGDVFGLFGIYLATLISRLLTNIWYDPYVIFKYGFKKSVLGYYFKYFRYLVILLICCFVTNLLLTFINTTLIFEIIIEIIICSICFNSVFYISFHKKKEFIYLYNFIKRLVEKVKK